MPEKIRVGLVLQGGVDWMGGVEYFTNLVKALVPCEEREEVAVNLFAHEVDRSLFAQAIPGFADRVLPFAPRKVRAPLWHRAWARAAGTKPSGSALLQRFAADHGIDLLYPYHFPYRPISWERTRVWTAAWIPDFQHKRMPEFFSAPELAFRDKAHAHAARHADCMVLSSHDAVEDFRQFHGAHRVRTEVLHFHTLPNAAWFEADPAEVLRAHRLPERFFFCANQFWMHKNHETLFRAVGALGRRGIRVGLVCTGNLTDHRRPEHGPALRRLLADLGIEDRVFLLGVIPRAEQVQLYRQAVAVVQPSLFEGWSTVVEDCRALGKTILLSDIPVHREQNPRGARFFEPRSVELLADEMQRAWDELPPGPHRDDEAAGRRDNAAAVERFGRDFLRIARTIVGSGSAAIRPAVAGAA